MVTFSNLKLSVMWTSWQLLVWWGKTVIKQDTKINSGRYIWTRKCKKKNSCKICPSTRLYTYTLLELVWRCVNCFLAAITQLLSQTWLQLPMFGCFKLQYLGRLILQLSYIGLVYGFKCWFVHEFRAKICLISLAWLLCFVLYLSS